MPPPHPTPAGHYSHPKEKKTPGGTSCHLGTPTQSLRRVVKPLGEHNRSRSHSPALDSLSVKDKRTPRSKTTMLPGVDLTRRFADSIHGPCSLATNRGLVDIRSPRGSPTLDRIHEGCPSSLGREKKGPGTGTKTRLRGVDDTPPVKKAIAFSTPYGKDSFRKHEKLVKRKDLNERFIHEAKKDPTTTPAIGTPPLSTKPPIDRHAMADIPHISKDLNFTQLNHIDGQSKFPMFRDLTMPMGCRFVGKANGSDIVSLTEIVSPRDSIHDLMAVKMGHRSSDVVDGLFLVKDAPSELGFNSTELFMLGPKSLSGNALGPEIWKDVRTSGAAISSSRKDVYRMENMCEDHMSKVDEYGGDAVLSPLLCKSPELMSKGFSADETNLNWELREDNVAQEWFRSRGSMSCFESFSGGSKTPEPQPSKSPELSKRAIGEGSRVGSFLGSSGVDRQDDVLHQHTPSPQATSSPEFLKRGSVPPSTGGCFGAGPLMGPEGRSVKDRRKCKPRGILTIEGEFLCSSGSAELFDEEVQFKETISVPALASVEWMVAEGCDAELTGQSSFRGSRNVGALDTDASLKISPGSFNHLLGLGECASAAPRHSRSKSAGSEQMFWKKGLLYEWNLSLSDQKRAESPSPVAEETRDSPIGKLRDFSPMVTPPSRPSDFTGNSLVLGALGSVTDTPPSCRASEVPGEDEVDSTNGTNRADNVGQQGSMSVAKALRELSLDIQSAPLSLSFSLESSPDSCESWQDMYTSESTRWSNASSRGEWGDYLRNNRYEGFDSQFRFHATEEHYPSTNVDTYTKSAFKEVSSTYSDRGDPVLCTPNSTVTSYSNNFESPDGDTWKKFSVSKGPKGVMLNDVERMSTAPFSRDASPDIVGISISISGAPSLDSSSDDFEVPRYHHAVEGVSMNPVHTTPPETGEDTKVHRERFHLYEADYSPSSLLKADAFSGVSVSVMKPRGS